MLEPATLQDLIRDFVDPQGLNAQQQRVCAHLIGCRTEALGGLEGRCDQCGAEHPRYRSCGFAQARIRASSGDSILDFARVS